MSQTKGRILRIERLSSFDGEGLRTVVFLKGCPLSCRWCSTPESQRSGTEFGVAVEKCTGCFACVDACPEDALAWDMKTERFFTDPARCTGCTSCTAACPTGARQSWGYTATVDEILREIEKDSLLYFHSGGGVTLSGGECLSQPKFCADLLERSLAHGIGTAIETCGQVPWESIEMVLPYTDTVFYDIKHMDGAAHRKLTGSPNTRILDNLKRIDAQASHLSLIIRMPLIPGINDQADNIKALGNFCKTLGKQTRVQLLPYHRLGIETYRRMSRPYPLESLTTPSQEEMETHTGILRQMGIKASAGG